MVDECSAIYVSGIFKRYRVDSPKSNDYANRSHVWLQPGLQSQTSNWTYDTQVGLLFIRLDYDRVHDIMHIDCVIKEICGNSKNKRRLDYEGIILCSKGI